MSIERVRNYFKTFGMEERILEFPVSSATVELAAEALHTEGRRIAKTLSFKTATGCMLILFAGDAKVDNHKFKARFGMKAKMLSPDEVDSLVGHSIGGVCPFGIPEEVEVYLDASLRRFYTVFPAAGSANSAIELTMDELFRYANAKDWVDVAKDWEPVYCKPFIDTPLPVTDLTDGEVRLVLERFDGADEKRGWVPAYHFRIHCVADDQNVGYCTLRLGYCLNIHYGGNIGYSVDEGYRGHHYAQKATRLLIELAKRHGLPEVLISCEPDNIASKHTIEGVPFTYIETCDVPKYALMYREGIARICRFHIGLDAETDKTQDA